MVKDTLAMITEQAKDKYAEAEIDPKGEHVVSLELSEKESVRWRFTSDAYDIAFGVKFVHADQSEQVVVPLKRVAANDKEQTGSFMAPAAGTVVFTWDNSYSMFRYDAYRAVQRHTTHLF